MAAGEIEAGLVLVVAEGERTRHLDGRLVQADRAAEEDAVELRVRGARRKGDAQSSDQPSHVTCHGKGPSA